MKSLFITAIALMVSLTLNAADVAGTWKGSMETQLGATQVRITIQPGATVAGKVQIAEYNAPIEKGKQEGDKISFQIRIDAGTVSYEGTVTGAEMKLNVTGTQGDSYVLSCQREK